MEFLSSLFFTLLYEPIFNILVFLYYIIPGGDFGVAVIVFTLIVKIVLYPLGTKAILTQKNFEKIQKRMKEVQEKFKDDKDQQMKEMMEVYRTEKMNPFSGCLPILAQIPILIAVFKVFYDGFADEQMRHLYSFMPEIQHVDTMFLGVVDLSSPFIPLALLAGLMQFAQTKTMFSLTKRGKEEEPKKDEKKSPNFQDMMRKQMMYVFPFFTFFILLKLSSALALYWIVNAGFTVYQQYTVLGKYERMQERKLKESDDHESKQ